MGGGSSPAMSPATRPSNRVTAARPDSTYGNPTSFREHGTASSRRLSTIAGVVTSLALLIVAGVVVPSSASARGTTGSPLHLLQPSAIAYDPQNHDLYVADEVRNVVAVVDPVSLTLIKTVPVGLAPDGLAFDPATGQMYVANSGDGTITMINPGFTLNGTVSVGTAPAGLAYDPITKSMFVANFGSNNVSEIPDHAAAASRTIPVGTGPMGVTYDPSDRSVLISNSGSGNFSVVSSRSHSVVATVPIPNSLPGTVGFGPTSIAFDSAIRMLYVASPGAEAVSVLNPVTFSVQATASVTGEPIAVAYDPTHQYVGVTQSGGAQLAILSAPTPLATGGFAVLITSEVTTDTTPMALSYSPPSKGFVTVNQGSASLTVYTGWANIRTVFGNSTVLNGPQLPAFDAGSDELFVPNTGNATVTVLHVGAASLSYVTSVPVGSNPWQAAYDPANGYIYVSNALSDNVTVINGTTNRVVTSIGVGHEPLGIIFDGLDNYGYDGSILVANFFDNNVSYINASTNTVLWSFGVGNGPFAIGGASNLGLIAVSNYYDSNISAVEERGWSSGRWGPFVYWNTAVCANPEGISNSDWSNGSWVVCPGSGQIDKLNWGLTYVTASFAYPGGASPTYANPIVVVDSGQVSGEVGIAGIGTTGEIVWYHYPTNSFAGISQVGAYPSGMATETIYGGTFVTDFNDDTVTIIG